MVEPLKFVKFDQEFLRLSLQWLRDPEIKELTETPQVSEERQLAWFHTLDGRDDYSVWGLMYGTRRIGAVGLRSISGGAAEYFGYIGEKDLWGKGIGPKMITLAETEAAAKGVVLLYLRVLRRNQRAMKLYSKMGYHDLGGGSNRAWMAKVIT